MCLRFSGAFFALTVLLHGFYVIPVKNKLPILITLFLFGGLLLFVPQQYALSKQESIFAMDPYGEAASAQKFVLKDYRLEGNRLIKSSELDAVMRQYMNVEISYQDLLAIKAEIEAHYARQNLAAVVLIPPQDLGTGVLTVELVESALTDKELLRALSQLDKVVIQVR